MWASAPTGGTGNGGASGGRPLQARSQIIYFISVPKYLTLVRFRSIMRTVQRTLYTRMDCKTNTALGERRMLEWSPMTNCSES